MNDPSAILLQMLYEKLDLVEEQLDQNMEELFESKSGFKNWVLKRERKKLVKRREFYERCIKINRDKHEKKIAEI